MIRASAIYYARSLLVLLLAVCDERTKSSSTLRLIFAVSLEGLDGDFLEPLLCGGVAPSSCTMHLRPIGSSPPSPGRSVAIPARFGVLGTALPFC